MTNTVFQSGEPFQFNACVGENGVVNYLTYADGYSKASNLLLEHVINNNGKDVDIFIYPICFNMRHSIELRIKGAIRKIENFAQIINKKIDRFNLATSHDINTIWLYFKKNSEDLVLRFFEINIYLNQTILDIGSVDSTGQVFRYPYDEKNNKHLIEASSINCLLLKKI